jgi:hypothetical protein
MYLNNVLSPGKSGFIEKSGPKYSLLPQILKDTVGFSASQGRGGIV